MSRGLISSKKTGGIRQGDQGVNIINKQEELDKVSRGLYPQLTGVIRKGVQVLLSSINRQGDQGVDILNKQE